MLTSYLIVILCFCAIGFLFFYIFRLKPNRKTGSKELYSEGLDMMINGLQRSAYNNFKKIVDMDTNNIKAYLRLGQVLRESGNATNALKIHKGLTIRQNLSSYDKLELYKNISLDYFDLGNTDKAIEQASKILKLDSKNSWAISKLITFHIKLNNWEKATEYLETFQRINKSPNPHKLGLFTIQQGRILLNENSFNSARRKFEKALAIDSTLNAAYYFIAESHSRESDKYFNRAEKIDDKNNEEYKKLFDQALISLSNAIPMWIKYSKSKPKQSWMVIHLLKDALFALDRYDELEYILKEIMDQDENNSEVIATLADMYAHKGDLDNALEIVNSSFKKNSNSLIIKLIKLKLLSLNGEFNVSKGLDDIIHFLVTDEGYHKYKNTPPDEDIVWIYENSDENKD
tara:strand:- start:17803 stop:19008 length:1206 start_codon:yes stop_codon:yes gene_type:complete